MALKLSELTWQIVKRDGRMDRYNSEKIYNAVKKAVLNVKKEEVEIATKIASEVTFEVEEFLTSAKSQIFEVEQIQDIVEQKLVEHNYYEVAKAYILYRQKRSEVRSKASILMQTYNDIVFTDAKDSEMKRENANVDGNTAMGTMLKIGSESAKEFARMYLLKPKHAKAHLDGEIHIHDLDFLPTGTLTCCQIDIEKLFQSGFSTGHGHLREPQDISSYGALAAIAIQSNQNDQHGGQSIPNFDYGLAKGVRKTFVREYREALTEKLAWELDSEEFKELLEEIKMLTNAFVDKLSIGNFDQYKKKEQAALVEKFALDQEQVNKLQTFAFRDAHRKTEKKTYQAMEAFLHNLNTMHSRAGAQVPFSSINYGTDTSAEGRMVTRQILLATEAGLGNGETAIFPIQVFKVKEGVSYNPEDPNYDLLKLSFRVSARRLFPNYVFLDAPYNIKYYQEGRPETEVVTMGCRTRVLGSVHPESDGVSYGRGNLSFTTINLPRLGIIYKNDIAGFFEALDEKIELVISQLHERYLLQARKRVKNFPFLMGQGIWFGADQLGPEDEIREVLKHGTLTCGFIGLAECLTAMVGTHHGESEEAQNLGVAIVDRIRTRLDEAAEKYRLNYTLIATPAEGLAGRFTRIDRKEFGTIEGVTDREYYTNSYHIPVHYEISAYDKIVKEAPYHALCNAGHISYIELDGAAKNNIEAFEQLIRAMKEHNIGYGSINHPIDRDPLCGYTGIIDDVCPGCGRDANSAPQIERIRRITGYLVGTMDKWNDGKIAEERERVKHGINAKQQLN
ncbi:anaerobic ribonucleoside triphosphate reductase [Desulfuribacillus alkaliarsenatis]|uniref:Anaerobic ribonucleoside-triphosphate reductase n=1 Tax=Desulfuribacillus alkaliarsenatis TaxID=766136 RepID=A0A1E5G4T7_9FIRM|nr:anaerobic ribonucleoside triphosphate reductase [Desulfuribacillus alkaliarsenatis]OEF98186.1 anaerobic ribonucleoside-triphosphate reductase [Desulfuribacillus alkaliarsenatis]